MIFLGKGRPVKPEPEHFNEWELYEVLKKRYANLSPDDYNMNCRQLSARLGL